LSGRTAARLAHRVETEMLGLQSGVQDQLCAAMGGICHIRLERYPAAAVDKLRLDPDVVESLGRRLMVVYLGRPHCSSDLHERVISLMRTEHPRLDTLRRMARLAGRARLSLERGDLRAFGRVMIENNECQRALCRELVSAEADEVIRLARRRRSSGWKVNGAGGRGGSLTLLASPDDGERRALARDIEALGRGIRTLAASISPSGLTVWQAR
jgi:D-glycero-alpha-D-manno-heptose-7-phosphate kinase